MAGSQALYPSDLSEGQEWKGPNILTSVGISSAFADPFEWSITNYSILAYKQIFPLKFQNEAPMGTIKINIFEYPNPSSLKKKKHYCIYYILYRREHTAF